jgi:hypothetical protein
MTRKCLEILIGKEEEKKTIRIEERFKAFDNPV